MPCNRCSDEDEALFANVDTKLDEIKAAGWSIDFSGIGYWSFVKREAGKPISRYCAPWWVHELARQAHDKAVEYTQQKIREALGISEPTNMVSCSPGFHID